jgi:transcriptional regulator with XRE-family HTH domain
MIGKYERGEATPSIEAAKKIADAFGVSLDYLVGEGQHATYDKEMVKRLDQIEELPEEEKQRIYHFMDLIIRDHTAKKAYSP